MIPIRLVIVDDHPVVRSGLRSLLAQYPDIQVVGDAESSQEAVEVISKQRPDIALIDVKLVGASGLQLARHLRRICSESRVIMLTSYDDESYLLEAVEAGVDGYLLKNASAEVLVDTIRAVYAGERRLSPTLITTALRQLEQLSRGKLLAESGLSEEEHELLRQLADGRTNQEISQRLFVSERTVKRRKQALFDKLQASSQAQAISEAYKRRLL